MRTGSSSLVHFPTRPPCPETALPRRPTIHPPTAPAVFGLSDSFTIFRLLQVMFWDQGLPSSRSPGPPAGVHTTERDGWKGINTEATSHWQLGLHVAELQFSSCLLRSLFLSTYVHVYRLSESHILLNIHRLQTQRSCSRPLRQAGTYTQGSRLGLSTLAPRQLSSAALVSKLPLFNYMHCVFSHFGCPCDMWLHVWTASEGVESHPVQKVWRLGS